LLRGNEPLGSISKQLFLQFRIVADSRATRSATRFSRFRRFEIAYCASSVGSDVRHDRPK